MSDTASDTGPGIEDENGEIRAMNNERFQHYVEQLLLDVVNDPKDIFAQEKVIRTVKVRGMLSIQKINSLKRECKLHNKRAKHWEHSVKKHQDYIAKAKAKLVTEREKAKKLYMILLGFQKQVSEFKEASRDSGSKMEEFALEKGQLTSDLRLAEKNLEEERKNVDELNLWREKYEARENRLLQELEDWKDECIKLRATKVSEQITSLTEQLRQAQQSTESVENDCQKWKSQVISLRAKVSSLERDLAEATLRSKLRNSDKIGGGKSKRTIVSTSSSSPRVSFTEEGKMSKSMPMPHIDFNSPAFLEEKKRETMLPRIEELSNRVEKKTRSELFAAEGASQSQGKERDDSSSHASPETSEDLARSSSHRSQEQQELLRKIKKQSSKLEKARYRVSMPAKPVGDPPKKLLTRRSHPNMTHGL